MYIGKLEVFFSAMVVGWKKEQLFPRTPPLAALAPCTQKNNRSAQAGGVKLK